MTDFADLIGAQSDSASFWTPPVFFPLTLVVLAALLLIPCNYYAFWRGAKSIYLMRRLPDRWELARRCLAIPLLTVACALLLVVILPPAKRQMCIRDSPQAVKAILPALGNEFIILLKDTSLITVIGGKELLYAAQGIYNRTYEQMFPLIGTAALYLVLVIILSWLLGKLERRLRQSDRR